MGRAFSDTELIEALEAAGKAHPPPGPWFLSKPVSKIAGVFGVLVFERAKSIQVDDPEICALIETFLKPQLRNGQFG